MKKITKILLGLISTVTAFSGLFLLNNNEENKKEIKYDEFYESVNDNNTFYDYGKSYELTPKKAYESDTLLDPIIKVQISDLSEDNKRSIRFVAAIPDLNISAKFVRTMYDESGEEFRGRKEYQVTEAYTSIISGDEVIEPSSFGEGYNYFVTYTMANVPKDYWYHVLDVDLVLEAKTSEDITLESNGSNEANIEGLMTKYYEETYDFTLLEDNTYEIKVKEDRKEEITYEIPSYRNVINESRPNVALKGNAVTCIGDYGFNGCINVQNILVPKGIIKVNNYAFEDCPSLTNISLPNTLTFIGNGVFGWSAIETINIPESVTSIGSYSFVDCQMLKNVILPSTLTIINDGLFCGCINLTNISIPNSLLNIGRQSFYGCSSLEEIVIPEGVTSIGDEAFVGCSSLTSIVIPKRVTSIGYCAFKWCDCLTNITLPFIGQYSNGNGATHFGYIFGASDYISNDEYVPNSLKKVMISNCTNIGSYAFYGCSSLTNVVISEGVTSIGEWTFYECSSLTDISLPNTLKSIGEFDFSYCSSLENVIIPEGVTSIGNMAFYECSSLTDIILPDTLIGIWEGAFEECSNIKSIIIPGSVKIIGDFVFYGCSSLENIDIPEGVTDIGERAFEYCSSLTNVTLPSTLMGIYYGPFSDCCSLKSIEVNENNKWYKSIDGNLYSKNGTELIQYSMGKYDKEFIIPESVTSIERYAFIGSSSLTNIVIPESVTSIEGNAFLGCRNLTIYCEVSCQPEGWDVDWNSSDRLVYWANEWKYVDGVPTPII